MFVWIFVLIVHLSEINPTNSGKIIQGIKNLRRPYDRNEVYFEYYDYTDGEYLNPLSVKTIRNTPDMLDVIVPPDYVASKRTFVYIHGFFSAPSNQFEQVELFYKNIDSPDCCNFLVLNWYFASIGNYWNIRKRTPEVSLFIDRYLLAINGKTLF